MIEPIVARDAEERGEGICRTCLAPIWNEGGTIGRRKRDTGWSDRIERGGGSLVCFKAIEYRHVPLAGREAEIYDFALARGTGMDGEAFDRLIDARVRAGVVTEEPEWEYGFQLRESDSGEVYDEETGFDTEHDATDAGNKRIHEEDDDEYSPLALRLIRRRKAGPWVPVKQEGVGQ